MNQRGLHRLHKWWGAAALCAPLLTAGCGFGSAATAVDQPDLAEVQQTAPPDMAEVVKPKPADMAMAVVVTTPPPDLAMVQPLQAGFDDPNLAARVTDYGLALRSASLKLVGDLPTADEIGGIATAPDPNVYYQSRIDAYLADPRFAQRMIVFFRNTFRAGGPATAMGLPSLDTAATFAADVVVSDRPFTDVVTATSGTCPTFDGKGNFTPANCNNGVQTAAGVLTDPGVMSLNTSNLGFRRTHWIQNVFACSEFPAEYSKDPMPLGQSVYTSPWDFTSIAGLQNGGRVDFLETGTLLCANCHTTINHIAPLVAYFDANGKMQNSIQVTTPIPGLPITVMTDWLPVGQQQTAWRYNVPAADLNQLGADIAADPVFATCITTRVWDWAMSKDDPLNDPALPPEIITPMVSAFTSGGFLLKATIRGAFTSGDYVKF